MHLDSLARACSKSGVIVRPDSLGYADPAYARALAGDAVVRLARTGASLVRRALPGAETGFDLAAPYPLLDAPTWAGLEDDLEDLRRSGAVSVVAVIEPLGAPPVATLARAFPALCRPFKRHFVAEIDGDPLARASKHHQRDVKRARKLADFQRIEDPVAALAVWCELYESLAATRQMAGASLLDERQFRAMLQLPGLSAYRATADGHTTGMALWIERGERAWFHLSATDERGRRGGASYGLVACALEDLAARGVRIADLGGGAGLVDDPSNGLAAFKRGWSTGEVDAYLCGAVLDETAYHRLAGDAVPADGYFPAYRARRPQHAAGVAR